MLNQTAAAKPPKVTGNGRKACSVNRQTVRQVSCIYLSVIVVPCVRVYSGACAYHCWRQARVVTFDTLTDRATTYLTEYWDVL
jgi:hypothetical protein